MSDQFSKVSRNGRPPLSWGALAVGALVLGGWALSSCGGGETDATDPGGNSGGNQAANQSNDVDYAPVRYDSDVIEDLDVRELLDEKIAAVEANRMSGRAHQMLALAYESNDQWKLAAESYGKAMRLNSKSIANPIHLAICLEQDGLVDEALAVLEETIGRTKDSHDLADQVAVRFNLGVAYLDRGNLEGARPLFQWILNHPQLAQFRGPAQLALAEILLEEDRPAEARTLIQQAMKGHPNDLFAMFLFGRALVELDQPGKAQVYLEKGSGAVRMPYGNSLTNDAAPLAVSKSKRLSAVTDLANQRTEASNRQALVLLRALQDRYPEDAVVLNNLSAILMRVNEFHEAFDVLNRIVTADEKEFPAWYNISHLHITIGETYRQQGDMNTAFQHYRGALLAAEKAVMYGPEVAEMHLQLGRAHMINQDLTLAMQALREALRLGSEDPDIYFNLATMEENVVSKEKAIRTMTEGIDRNPTWIEGRLVRARLLFEVNDVSGAADEYMELNQLAPSHEGVVRLGIALGLR